MLYRNIFLYLAIFIPLFACQSPKKIAKKGLYYETTVIKTPQITIKQKNQLVATIINNLKKRSLHQTTSSGVQKIKVNQATLKSLPFTVLKALWIASDRKYYGAELDLKLKDEKGTAAAVSVWVSKKGTMKFSVGKWPSFNLVKSPQTLQEKWKIGGIKHSKDRKWSPNVLGAIDYALALLSNEERSLLDDIPVIRRKVNAQNSQRGALYIQEGDCDAKIVVYDLAVSSQSYQFVGDLSKIYPSTTLVMLHEIGHAIHERKLRETQCAYLKSVNTYNNLVKQKNPAHHATLTKEKKQIKLYEKKMKRLLKMNPMLKAYKKVRGANKGPTVYGKTSIKESFAEAFALYKADPKALKRIYPKVYAWFKANKHLKHLDFSDLK